MNFSDLTAHIPFQQLKQNLKSFMENSVVNEKKVKDESLAAALLIKADADLVLLKLSKMEAEREVNASYQKDIMTLKMKNADLEEKIKRQDQYMKNRLLKDKSNFNSAALCTPAPSESSYRPPSARAIADAATAATITAPSTEIRASGPSVRAMR